MDAVEAKEALLLGTAPLRGLNSARMEAAFRHLKRSISLRLSRSTSKSQVQYTLGVGTVLLYPSRTVEGC